jgi:hypothetical protein
MRGCQTSRPSRTRRRDKLTIHLYALCWNEVRMLPYFFRHYDPVVDQYFIADHDSTDGSLAALRRHPRVAVSRFRSGPSFVVSATEHYNRCWKQSRHVADWVFVVNIDEHLYHRRLRGYLRSCSKRGISVVRPEGYNMVAGGFPASEKPLWKTIRYGSRSTLWDKPQFFDPDRIDEINFHLGRHAAAPAGDVVYPPSAEARLLHYKYLGAEYMIRRHAEIRTVFPQQDLDRGWGYQYTWDRAQNLREWQQCRESAVRVL